MSVLMKANDHLELKSLLETYGFENLISFLYFRAEDLEKKHRNELNEDDAARYKELKTRLDSLRAYVQEEDIF